MPLAMVVARSVVGRERALVRDLNLPIVQDEHYRRRSVGDHLVALLLLLLDVGADDHLREALLDHLRDTPVLTKGTEVVLERIVRDRERQLTVQNVIENIV